MEERDFLYLLPSYLYIYLHTDAHTYRPPLGGKEVMAGSPDQRWESLRSMPPDEWAIVAPRVSVCLHCLGPALLTDAELGLVIAEPLCTRCRRRMEAVA